MIGNALGALWWWLFNRATQALYNIRKRRAVARRDRAGARYWRAKKRFNRADKLLQQADDKWFLANRALQRGGYDG